MKNYVKEGQKLPMFGIGPYLIAGMGIITLICMLLSNNYLISGKLEGIWVTLFRIAGSLLIVSGVIIWYIGAVRSDMDDSITENRLKTDGIYAWVRNPMYSGLWIIITGVGMMCHNAWILITPVINWGLMTVVLINTEEKWLCGLYGKEYDEYRKHVNRCIPWKRHR